MGKRSLCRSDSYATGKATWKPSGYPNVLNTLGDHLEKRRLALWIYEKKRSPRGHKNYPHLPLLPCLTKRDMITCNMLKLNTLWSRMEYQVPANPQIETGSWSRLRSGPSVRVGPPALIARPALDSWWLLSWMLTLLRVPVLTYALYLLAERAAPTMVVTLVAALVLLDILDGEVHKLSTLNTVEHMRNARHIFDAIGDRVTIHLFFLVAIGAYGNIAALAYVPVLCRELPLIVLVSHTALKRRIILRANLPSKLASALIATIAANIVVPFSADLILVPLMLTLGAVGLYQYVARGIPA